MAITKPLGGVPGQTGVQHIDQGYRHTLAAGHGEQKLVQADKFLN